MSLVPILVREQIFRDNAVFKLRRQSPFARHHVVTRKVPPEVVMQALGAAVDLPPTENIECLTVHDEHTGWPIRAILAAAAKRADIDAFGATMNRMGP